MDEINPHTTNENVNLKKAKIYVKCKQDAIKSITTCFYPGCNDDSINSHILQKNGILSSLATNGHLWEPIIHPFKQPAFKFKRQGINKVYSFNCFCNTHDSTLFKKIESGKINFNDYESCLLFTLRTIYNEIFRKQVNIGQYNCQIKAAPDLYNNALMYEEIEQENLGLNDLKKIAEIIWSDLFNASESFVFNYRVLTKLDLCLSSFYVYETTEEVNKYKEQHGTDIPWLSPIFINFFPIEKESLLLMGYLKQDESKLKGYFNTFFKESEKRTQRKITNLIVFQCETWTCSDELYNSKIKENEDLLAIASEFSGSELYLNERQFFDLNIYSNKFKEQLIAWSKNMLIIESYKP